MNQETIRCGVIGLGAMGQEMARNLRKAGLLVAVWNRSQRVANDLAGELLCHECGSPEELAERVNMVLICVSADDDLLEVIQQIKPALDAKKLVIDCSTVSRKTAIKAATVCGREGAGFLDCPVSGGVEGAKNGQLAVMCGGDAADFERARSVLSIIGKSVTHMGPVGSGQATKAVNQIMVAGINQGVVEALAFAQQQKLPMDKVIDVVGSGAAGNWYLDHRGKTMVARDFRPGFKLALHHKDLRICEKMALEINLDLPIVAKTVSQYQLLMEAGYGEEDTSALYRLKVG